MCPVTNNDSIKVDVLRSSIRWISTGGLREDVHCILRPLLLAGPCLTVIGNLCSSCLPPHTAANNWLSLWSDFGKDWQPNLCCLCTFKEFHNIPWVCLSFRRLSSFCGLYLVVFGWFQGNYSVFSQGLTPCPSNNWLTP